MSNSLKKIREELLISRSELARRSGVSLPTIYRIENDMNCRMDTKRKILQALEYDLSEREKVFRKD